MNSRAKARAGTQGQLVLLAAVLSTVAAAQPAAAQDIDACIDASEKAVALRRNDQLIEARDELSTCAAAACPDPVKSSCQQRLAEVVASIPSIVLVTRDSLGRDVSAVKLAIDGSPYSNYLDGRAIPLNPGEHEFQLQGSEGAPAVKRFILHEGEQNRREEILLGAPPPPPALPPAMPPAVTQARLPPTSPDPANSTAIRTAGLVVGGIGVAGLAAGGVLGILSMIAHDGYEQQCGPSGQVPAGFCNPQGVSGEQDAATKGTWSTALFIGGGVALVAGVALVVFAPRPHTDVRVGLGPFGVFLGSSF